MMMNGGGYPETWFPQQAQQTQFPQPYPGYGRGMQGPQQPDRQNHPQPNMICRPVASEEEARAVPTDFGGAVTIMPDFAHGWIYTKMLNFNDGSPIFHAYQVQHPAPPQPPVEYAPLNTVQALADEIEQLKQSLAAADKPAKQPKGSAEK